MKILAIDHTAVQRGNRNMFHSLAAREGVTVDLLVPAEWRENYTVYTAEDEPEGSPLNLFKGRVLFKGRPHMMLFIETLAYLIRNKPDVIYVNTEPENFLLLQVLALRALFSRRSKVICITWRNIQYFWNTFPYKLGLLNAFAEKISFRYADACRAMNHDGKKYIQEKGFRKPVDVISWGVDTHIFKPHRDPAFRDKQGLSSIVVGFMGRVVPSKGIDLILAAVAQLKRKDISILIIGNGPDKARLQLMAKNLSMQRNLHIVETVNYNEVPRWINAMDMLVLPSRTTATWKEQFGRVLVEATACGVPVIGSDSGEIPFVIADAGLVFHEGDSSELAKKIEQVINGPDKDQLNRRSIERAENIYAWEKIADQMYGFILKVLENRTGAA